MSDLGRESGPPSARTMRPIDRGSEVNSLRAEDRMHEAEHEPEGWEEIEDPYADNHA